ncbi:MAG: class II aldolase/adducin family protein [Firmicutes bacterium]|nr:class II aldolase/adducin family protein [Bacillota bacterium]
MSEFQLKRDIIEVGRRIYNSGFVAANDGNISVRLSDKLILTTPTGVSKGFMTPDMIVTCDMDGNVVSGSWRPSSELKMHLAVYKAREDVKSVVHAHPPYGTAFAVAGFALEKPIMPEVVINLGWVPLTQYGTPSTEEIPDAVLPYLPRHDAFLLQNHGALTVGSDPYNALFKMETLEMGAKISLLARLLGGEKEISPPDVDRLIDLRQSMNMPGMHPGLESTAQNQAPVENSVTGLDEKRLREIVTNVVKEVIKNS